MAVLIIISFFLFGFTKRQFFSILISWFLSLKCPNLASVGPILICDSIQSCYFNIDIADFQNWKILMSKYSFKSVYLVHQIYSFEPCCGIMKQLWFVLFWRRFNLKFGRVFFNFSPVPLVQKLFSKVWFWLVYKA